MLFPPPRHRRNPIHGRRRFYSSFNWRYSGKKPKTVTVLNKDFDKRLRASVLRTLYGTRFRGDERIANFLISLRATCRKTFTPVRDSGEITKFIRRKDTTFFHRRRVPSVSRSRFAHMVRVRFRLANLHATFDIWYSNDIELLFFRYIFFFFTKYVVYSSIWPTSGRIRLNIRAKK